MILFGRKREEGRRISTTTSRLPIPSQIFCLYIGVAPEGRGKKEEGKRISTTTSRLPIPSQIFSLCI
ncbi:MAG: hypothetical protein F6K39_13560 [Okeania sp. SIO3B3]|nr:hypothetical protein [Okeania sp. SIO3B3]